jgi:hypothetical protein
MPGRNTPREGDPEEGTVYLEHLDQPLCHARHYLGWTAEETPDARHRQHVRGVGARMLQVANERGITYGVARTWPGARDLERRLKGQHNSPRLCPICSGLLVEDDGDDSREERLDLWRGVSEAAR